MLDVPVGHVWWHRSVEAEIWTWKKPERRSCLWHRFPTEYTSVCWVFSELFFVDLNRVAKSCTSWYVVYPPIGFQPSKVVQDFAGPSTVCRLPNMWWYWHGIFDHFWSLIFPFHNWTLYCIYIYIYSHPITFLVRYFLFGLVALRQKNQPSPISHIQSAECPQKSLCDSPRNWPRIPKTAICGLSEPNSFGEVVAGSTGKIPGLDDHLNTAGSRMWCYTFILPRCSMYGILTNICPKNHPNVGKYTIHGAYGLYII